MMIFQLSDLIYIILPARVKGSIRDEQNKRVAVANKLYYAVNRGKRQTSKKTEDGFVWM